MAARSLPAEFVSIAIGPSRIVEHYFLLVAQLLDRLSSRAEKFGATARHAMQSRIDRLESQFHYRGDYRYRGVYTGSMASESPLRRRMTLKNLASLNGLRM